MENNAIEKNEINSSVLNRWAYGTLLLAGLLALAFKDWMMAIILTGIALGFDPFNTKQAWTLRPLWQKAWLLIHLILVFSLLVIDIFIKK